MGSLFWELLALGGAFCHWDFVCPQFPLVVWWFVSAVCFAGLFRLPFALARSCWATRGLMSKLPTVVVLGWSQFGLNLVGPVSFGGSKPVLTSARVTRSDSQ
jgi:hypothetical protein